MTADTAARAAPTMPARWNPSTKARSAVRARAAPAARGRLPATCSAPASDDRAVARAAGARARSGPPSPLAYREAARLPSTATPRAAPSSRVVSFIPAPAQGCQQPGRDRPHAGSQGAVGAEGGGETGGLRCDHDHDEGDRHEAHRRGERAVAEHELEVQREQEDDAVQGEEDEDHAARADGERPVEEVPDLQRRMLDPQLPC